MVKLDIFQLKTFDVFHLMKLDMFKFIKLDVFQMMKLEVPEAAQELIVKEEVIRENQVM